MSALFRTHPRTPRPTTAAETPTRSPAECGSKCNTSVTHTHARGSWMSATPPTPPYNNSNNNKNSTTTNTKYKNTTKVGRGGERNAKRPSSHVHAPPCAAPKLTPRDRAHRHLPPFTAHPGWRGPCRLVRQIGHGRLSCFLVPAEHHLPTQALLGAVAEAEGNGERVCLGGGARSTGTIRLSATHNNKPTPRPPTGSCFYVCSLRHVERLC